MLSVSAQEYTASPLFGRVRAAMIGELSALNEPAPADLPATTQQAFAVAVRALRYFALGTDDLPSVAEVDALAQGDYEARSLAAIAAGRIARASLLNLDGSGLAIWIDVLETLDVDVGTAPLASARGWAAALVGDGDAVRDAAETLRQEASTRGWPSEVIEASVLKSIGASIAGDFDEAVQLARRASRMSRTESLPQEEYLANVVLARFRRMSGKPHLSARILSALLRVATPPWHRWMKWELLLAGMSPDVPSPGAAALMTAIAHARAGESDAMHAQFELAHEEVAGFHSLAEDLTTFETLIVGTESSFATGGEPVIPRGLAALGVMGADEEAAWVLADSQGARRVLQPGRNLHGDRHRLSATKQRQARTETAIASLLLAGPTGSKEEVFFERIYGFAFEERHRNVRDVLYHRVRDRIGDLATLERIDGMVRLVATQPIAVPDPRCSPPAEHSLLLVLASRGFASPRQAADALGIPMRTVQDALKRLAADGACRPVKKGRKLEYHLEDTTFLEPTRV